VNTTGVAVGNQAGLTAQGTNAIAIGNQAGKSYQAANSIVLNATGTEMNPYGAGFYVGPIANMTSSAVSSVSLLGYGADSQVTQTAVTTLSMPANPYAAMHLDVGNALSNPFIGRALINGTEHTADKRDTVSFGRLDGAGSNAGLGGAEFLGMKCIVDTHNILGYGSYANQSALTFHTWGNSVSISREVMRINSYGAVGIGTSNPACAFHVNGGTGLQAFISSLGITGGSNVSLGIGKSFTSNNCATYLWNHVADGSTSNYLGLGVYGGDNKLCVTAGGNVGIGTSIPGASLDVPGTVKIGIGTSIGVGGGGAKLALYGDSNGQNPMGIQAYNDAYYIIFFNNSTGGYRGSIQGVTGGSIAFNSSSDQRLKRNVQDMTSMISKIKQLKPRTYTWKSSGDKDDGFVAQEVHKVFPQMMTSAVAYCDVCHHSYSDLFDGKLCDCCDFENPVDKEGKPHYYGLDYGKFTPYLTKALQETIEIVEQQAATIASQKAQLDALMAWATSQGFSM
jgi:hypothetical protein